MRQFTDQKKLCIWTLFTQCEWGYPFDNSSKLAVRWPNRILKKLFYCLSCRFETMFQFGCLWHYKFGLKGSDSNFNICLYVSTTNIGLLPVINQIICLDYLLSLVKKSLYSNIYFLDLVNNLTNGFSLSYLIHCFSLFSQHHFILANPKENLFDRLRT